MRDMPIPASDIKCYEPHMNMGIPMKDLQISTRSKDAEATVKLLNKFVAASYDIIQGLKLELNCKADSLFIWSPSSTPRLPSFHKKFNFDAAIVAAMDFLHGLAKTTRMEYHKIPGTTGYSNTDLNAKLEMAKRYLDYNDLVFIHINAPDEESHIFNLNGKIKIIERIDLELVKPLKEHLDQKYPDNYRLAILPDHYTYVKNGKHDDKLVPFALLGYGIKRDDVNCFCEKEVAGKSRTILASYDFMNTFIY